MHFAVKRLLAPTGPQPEVANYHLLDRDGALLMVADQTVGPDLDERRQVRLARPDGRLLATIDLPEAPTDGVSPKAKTDYAIIHDYAVYAIVSVHHLEPEDNGNGVYFSLEVEGEKWLALPDPELDLCYALYDDIPAGIHSYDAIAELDLPLCIGRICLVNSEAYAFTVDLAPYRLEQTGLVVLALAVLIDRAAAELR